LPARAPPRCERPAACAWQQKPDGRPPLRGMPLRLGRCVRLYATPTPESRAWRACREPQVVGGGRAAAWRGSEKARAGSGRCTGKNRPDVQSGGRSSAGRGCHRLHWPRSGGRPSAGIWAIAWASRGTQHARTSRAGTAHLDTTAQALRWSNSRAPLTSRCRACWTRCSSPLWCGRRGPSARRSRRWPPAPG